MKHVIGATVAAILLAGSPAFSHDQESSGRRDPHEEGGVRDRETSVAVHVAWRARDVDVVRAHYETKHHGRLPPGLEKKYERTGQLPPGWEKKMKPLPSDLERKLPPLPQGYHRGIIEGRAVIYDTHSTIVDIAVVF
jgi:hypothetical protein